MLTYSQYLYGSHDEHGRHLSKLPYADGAAFNSRLWEHESECLSGTRVDLLQEIITWSNDPNGACIFWLNGIAGTGKSTIARTVARTWSGQNRLGASFLFSKGHGDLGHAAKLFTTLATQLAHTVPSVKKFICTAIEENPDIFQRGLGDQWKYLILQPLSNLTQVSPQLQLVIFVIDALDECEGDDDIRLILRLISEAKSLATVRLRLFVTSRPETPIRFEFHAIPTATHQDFVLHTISQSTIENDISLFLRHELENIRRDNAFHEGWPDHGTVALLCQKARGLFIYASTACRFIRDMRWDPDERLPLILKDDYVGQSAMGELDEMYTRILKQSIGLRDLPIQEQARLSGEFRQIVGSIVILSDFLSVSALAVLLDLRVATVNGRLRGLHSVLDVPKSQESRVRLLHPSFRDFLLDQQRCFEPQFWINEKKAHSDLFVSCLKLMSKRLHRDMCNLQLPDALISEVKSEIVERCLPLDIQYACRYWVHHLQRSNIELRDDDQVHNFLRKHFLHWFEALSLIRKISDSVPVVRILESTLPVGNFVILSLV